MAPRVVRRLAAILAADVVGYSRLMQADEAGTHARLKALRRELIEPRIADHGGRIVKLTGDGILVEFQSVVEAVLAAADVQRAVTEHQAGVAEAERIAFRIGINLGDVIFDEDDIYGDGVNVAARLEGLAEPGGICVSRTVCNHVKTKVDLGFEAAGAHQVKNIAEPVEVYRIRWDGRAFGAATPALRWGSKWARRLATAAAAVVMVALLGGGAWWYALRAPTPEPTAASSGEAGAMPALPLPNKPSIVVLPFRDMSHDSEQEHFADALTEDIVTGLARFDDLFVISSNSSFRYKGEAVNIKEVGRELGVRFALEGSIRRSDGRLRVTAQLIDATTDEHLWAETYDREFTAANFFEVQDAIAAQVVGTLGGFDGRLAASASEIAKRKNTDSLEAYELYVLATHLKQHEFTEDAHKKMTEYFQKAIEKDPDFALPYMGLGWMEMRAFWGGWSPDPQKTLEQALEYGQKALGLDPNHAMIHLLLGDVYASMGQLDRGIAEHDKARALNPNDPDIMKEAAGFLAFAGRTDEAIELQTDAMRLDPFYPDTYLWNAAIVYYTARDYDAVIDAVERMREPPADALLFMAASYAQLGRLDDAEATIRRVLALDPDATVAKWAAQQPYKSPDDLDHYKDGLRKAGLPDGGLTN